MPIYEYICQPCGARFELLTTISKADEATCPKCGASDVKRQMSTFASVVAKDSGPGCDSCEMSYDGAPGCGCMGGCCGH